MKTCRICKVDLPLSAFYADPRYRLGVKAECKKCANKASCQWAKDNKQTRLNAARAWRNKNREHCLQYHADWRNRNRTKCRRYSKKSKTKHADRIKQVRSAWSKANYPRLKQDLGWYLRRSFRNRLTATVTGDRLYRVIPKLLGCSVEDFRIYLETKFEPGMSWENHGEWEIDHIMPCAIFDLTKPEHQRRCFHFSNLQPLWRSDNRRKSCKVVTNQFNLL